MRPNQPLLPLLAAFLTLVALPVHAQTETNFYDFSTYAVPGGLIQASDGNFYGTTIYGGVPPASGSANCMSGVGCGSIFQLNPAGTVTDIYDFAGTTDGANPISLLEGPDGFLYGVAQSGGNFTGTCALRSGCGTLFKVSTAGEFISLHTFTGSADSLDPSSLVLSSDGILYGTASGFATTSGGAIFSFNPATNAFTTIYQFPPTDFNYGTGPGGLLQASDGNLYGVTGGGSGPESASCCGTIFRLNASNQPTTLYSFQGAADGSGPLGLVEGKDGNLYGTTATAINTGSYAGGEGSIFKLSLSGTFSVVYAFDFFSPNTIAAGVLPDSLIVASDGNLYGATQQGGPSAGDSNGGSGAIFELSSTGTPTALYAFPASELNGAQPEISVQGSNGQLYGSTAYGGVVNGGGTLYSLALSPTLAAPVRVSLAQSQITVGAAGAASFQVLNAFSMTAQTCYGFITGNGATTDLGQMSGSVAGSIYSGTFSFTPATVGSYSVAVTCGGTESGSTTLAVVSAGSGPGIKASVTSLSSSPVAPSVGQPVTLKVNVSGASSIPTGTVTFYGDGDVLGSAAVSGGVATLAVSTNGLPTNTYYLTANYSGDSTYAKSTSATDYVALAAAPTATSVAAVTSTGLVTLTATVARTASGAVGAPTGSVTFFYLTNPIGTASLNANGVATVTINTTYVPQGSYSINAKYYSDAVDTGSTSGYVTVLVQ